MTVSVALPEAAERFTCFGGDCAVFVAGSGPAGGASQAAARARRALLAWHDQFSRFIDGSELSRLNRDRRESVPVSPVMARFAAAAVAAAEATDGLFDPTLVGSIEEAGYRESFTAMPVPLADVLELAPARRPAAASPAAAWREVLVDRWAGTVTRPPGMQLDGGGLLKGLFGDILATVLDEHESFAIDSAGDIRFGGQARRVRPIQIADPFGGPILHVLELVSGAAATSGIGRRSWLDAAGRPAHHLLDPATGRSAFTGIVQVTALAPRAEEAEMLSKAALLSGPDGARTWLAHGGAVVHDDGTCDVIEPDAALAAR